MKKIIILFCLFIFFSVKSSIIFGQVTACYVKQMGLKTITKDEFLKVDSIMINNNNYLVSQYYVYVSGMKNGKNFSKFWLFYGARIDKELKNWVSNYDSCQVAFDEIVISKKADYTFTRMCSPFAVDVK